MNYVTLDDGTVVPVDANGNLITGYLPLIITPPPPVSSTTRPPERPPTSISTTTEGFTIPAATPPPPIPAPIANFSFTLYADGFVGFTNLSLGSIGSYLWSFGDGATSTSPSPLHQYASNTSYVVTLTVTNASGSSSAVDVVAVTSVAAAPTVDFSFVYSGLGVQFTDTSTKSGLRVWSFGDLKTSNDINPYHLYSSNGIYEVTLTIGDAKKTRQVVVDRGVDLMWTSNSGGSETGFKIYRSPDGSTGWVQIGTTGTGVTSLLVTQNINSVDPTAVNYFKVFAYNGGGDSGPSNVIETQCL